MNLETGLKSIFDRYLCLLAFKYLFAWYCLATDYLGTDLPVDCSMVIHVFIEADVLLKFDVHQKRDFVAHKLGSQYYHGNC